jgi:DNA-binding NarL/FixJ family response regulator
LPDSIRVLIADDHAVVRHGLSLFLGLQPDMTVVGEAVDGADAVSKATSLEPDVVLMDLVMPVRDGIQATRAVIKACPRTKVLVLTSFVEDDKLFPAIRAGAAGYMMKDVAPEQLAEAIRTVHRGDPLLHPEVTRRLMSQLSDARRVPEGTVTIIFTDIVGSTEFFDRLGDERAREIFREHDRLLRDSLKRHGGVEVKHLGDGFMMAFSSARRALECAVDIQRGIESAGRDHPERAFGVRVGLTTGEAISEDQEYFGETVILASRIAALAGGGRIFVSEVTRALVGSSAFRFVDLGEHGLKGFKEPRRLFEVSWGGRAWTASPS